MNALAEYVTEPLKRTLGALCDAVPFSVAEVLIVVAVQVGIFYLCVLVIDLFRREDKKICSIVVCWDLRAQASVFMPGSVFFGVLIIILTDFRKKAGFMPRVFLWSSSRR